MTDNRLVITIDPTNPNIINDINDIIYYGSRIPDFASNMSATSQAAESESNFKNAKIVGKISFLLLSTLGFYFHPEMDFLEVEVLLLVGVYVFVFFA